MGGRAHLFDMPNPRPSQSPSERASEQGRPGQEERKDNECVQDTKVAILVEAQALMCDWLHAIVNNSEFTDVIRLRAS